MSMIGISLSIFSYSHWLLKFSLQFIAHSFPVPKLFFFCFVLVSY